MFGTVTLNPCIDKTVTVNDFRAGKLNRIISSIQQPAGKGINSSIVYKNLGGGTFCTGINYLSNRQVIEDYLAGKGIDNDFFTVAGELRTNLKVFNLKKNEITEINASGYKVPDDYETKLLDKISNLSKGFDTLLLGGSVPAGVDKDIYAKIIDTVSHLGIKVVLDADGELFSNAVKARPYMIKPNDYELELYTGKKISSYKEIVKIVREEFIDKGISLVCVSLGADGAMIIDDKKAYRANGLKVQVKGTVGAGDSMVAGIVFGQSKGYGIDDLIRSGVASATSSIVKEGTELCDLQGYNKYFPMVTVQKLNV